MRKVLAVITVLILNFTTVYAQFGDNGFEGGISSGGVLNNTTGLNKSSDVQTYYYKELVLVTGTPLVFEGTVKINRKITEDMETYTYTYSLTNGEKNKLTRSCTYESNVTKTDNQTIRIIAPKQGGKPRETVSVDGVTYTLTAVNNQNFSMSTITDRRPACDYYAGNWSGEKLYKATGGRTVTVAMTSRIYGYEQVWGSTETQEISVSVSGETLSKNVYDIWGGQGTIKILSSTSKKLIYIDNKPDAISFEGGYLKKQENNSVFAYDLFLPLFDSDNIATDTILNYNDKFNISSFPLQERLNVPDTTPIRGHWYEEDFKQLLSLGVLDNNYINNYTELGRYITRKEFAKAAVEAAGLKPLLNPAENKKPSGKNMQQETTEKLPFYDVDTDDEFYQYIFTLYKQGVMSGTSDYSFSPNEPLSRAQAIVIFVRLLGLGAVVSSDYPVTGFSDNDTIPDWARNAVAVAVKIGIVKGDDKNHLNPHANLSKEEGAVLLNNLITYMRDNMAVDYRNSIISGY